MSDTTVFPVGSKPKRLGHLYPFPIPGHRYHMRQCIEAFRRQLRRWLKLDIVSAENMITFRHNLTEVLRHYRIDTVLDVGANEGQFAAMLRQGANFRGTIHSFEPASQSFAKLMTRAASDSSWHVHRLALGRSPGEVTLNLSEYSTFSSLLRPSIFGTGTFSDIRVVNTEKVPMSTLDIFVKEHFAEGDARILLKMDTQGFDLEVFDGASESIPRICALISELSLMPIYEGMPRYDEMLETYEKSGFAVSGIFPVTRTSDLALIEVDCLMIRRDTLPYEGQLAGMASLPSNRGILLHQVDDSVTPRAGATRGGCL